MDKICRLCLCFKDSHNMVPLIDFSSDSGLSSLGRSAKDLADISIAFNDGLPANMCEDCQISLQQALLFKNMCKQNDEVLHNIMDFSRTKKTDFTNSLTEFVMFKTSFPEDLPKNYVQNCCDNLISEFMETSSNSHTPEYMAQCELAEDKKMMTEVAMDVKDILQKPQVYDFESIQNSSQKLDKKNVKIRKTDAEWNYLENFVEKKLKKVKKRRTYTERKKIENRTCNICNKTFVSHSKLRRHMKLHGEKMFYCEVCAERFKTARVLKCHQQGKHQMWEQFTCDECGHTVPTKNELMMHMRRHTGEKPYSCDKCDLKFTRRYVWKQHALVHMEKTVTCPKCPMKFRRTADMMSHYNTHERLYLFQCHLCEVTYAGPDKVRRHLLNKHGVPKEKQGKIRKIKVKDKPTYLAEENIKNNSNET